MEVAKREQCSYIQVAELHNQNVQEYLTELQEALDEHPLSHQTVAKWVKGLKHVDL